MTNHSINATAEFDQKNADVPDAEVADLRRRRNTLIWIVAIVFFISVTPILSTSIIVIYFEGQPWASEITRFGYYYYKFLFSFGLVGVLIAAPIAAKLLKTQRRIENVRLQIAGLRAGLPRDLEGALVEINLKYLDQYYLETRIQANKSFSASLLMGIVGFCVTCVSMIMFFKQMLTPAMLTLAAGTITNFISVVFFYLFNRTVLNLASYHQKLVFTQNIALAMKIAQSVPDSERIKMSEIVLSSLLANINEHLAGTRPESNLHSVGNLKSS